MKSAFQGFFVPKKINIYLLLAGFVSLFFKNRICSTEAFTPKSFIREGTVGILVGSDSEGLPLGAQSDPEKYKVIFFDVAVTQQLLGLDLKGWLLKPEDKFVNQGGLVESFIGQEMIAYAPPDARKSLFY